jgi:hypothetical protein
VPAGGWCFCVKSCQFGLCRRGSLSVGVFDMGGGGAGRTWMLLYMRIKGVAMLEVWSKGVE